MTSSPLQPLLDQYQREGFARLGKVMTPDRLEALRQRADEMMLGKVSYPGLFFQKDPPSGRYEDLDFKRGYEGPSLSYRKVERVEKDPLFWDWITDPIFEAVADAVIGGPIVMYRAMIFNKASSGGTNLPWHQDGGKFWGLDRDPHLQIWTALDDAPVDGGCVEVVPGTHVDGLATPLGGTIPDACIEAAGALERLRPLPAEAGEAILIHNHVWHRSGRNHTQKPRRALSVCYMSAKTRCLRKRRAPRTFVPVFGSSQV